MIIVLKQNPNKERVEELIRGLESRGIKTNTIVGSGQTVIGLVGDTAHLDIDTIKLNAEVDKVLKVQEPFKRANRKFHPDDTVISVGGVTIGGKGIVLMAGPCSVESEKQVQIIAEGIKGGAHILRGGAYKPRSSPYAFQGLKAEGLDILSKVSGKTGIPVISEVTNPYTIEQFVDKVDIIQVGARNMQNFELLKELGTLKKPVLLKRGFANTLEEFLMSAEYVMHGGNQNVILCERGIRTFEHYTRNTLDISAIPILKKLSHLPVVVDPSHASGIRWMVESLSLAAVAAGADGLIIEVHNNPDCALCDGAQSLNIPDYMALVEKLRRVAAAVGREI